MTWVAALTVTVLGVAASPALAVTKFDSTSLSFDSSGTPQTVTLTSDEGAKVNKAAVIAAATGSGPATGSALNFSITGNTCSVDAGNGCTITVKYTGSDIAGASLNLGTDKGTKSVLLRANAPKSTVCTPSGGTSCGTNGTLAFTTVAGTPVVQTFDIRNGGPDLSAKANLVVASVTATGGPYTADTSGCPAGGLAPNTRCTVIVTFLPGAAGSFPGTLTVNSNDPITPGPTITVTGTASPAAVVPPPIQNVNPGTGKTPTTPGTGARPKRPAVTGFTLSPRALTIGSKGAFKFTLAASGRVTIKLERRLPGKRIRYTSAGSLTLASAKAGRNSVTFRGKVGSRVLKKGTYRASITARNAAGAAATKRVSFILKSKKR